MITHPHSQYRVHGSPASFYIYDTKAVSGFITWVELKPNTFYKITKALAKSPAEFDRVCAELRGVK